MTAQKVTVKVMTITAQNHPQEPYTFKAYKLNNGLILVSKYEFIGTDIDLRQLNTAKIISSEETGKQLKLTEQQYSEMFFDENDEGRVYIIATKTDFTDLAERVNTDKAFVDRVSKLSR